MPLYMHLEFPMSLTLFLYCTNIFGRPPRCTLSMVGSQVHAVECQSEILNEVAGVSPLRESSNLLVWSIA
jgi:hypothetical protein